MGYERWDALSSGEVFTMPRKTQREGDVSEGRPKTTRRRVSTARTAEAPAAPSGPAPACGLSAPGDNVLERMNSPTEEEIRMRAYMIYLSRNGAPGDPVADWLQAERELNALMRGEPLPRTGASGQAG
jgi:hypothetical protein